MFYVYQILNKLNGKKYIGKTIDPEARWRAHQEVVRNQVESRMFLIHRVIIKYGIENFKFKVLFKFDNEQDAFNKEMELIALYKTCVPDHGKKAKGYNLTRGGEGAIGTKVSDDKRDKLAKSKLGEKNPQASLTDSQVLNIKKLLWEEHKSCQYIAKQYGVRSATIRHIRDEKNWKHIKYEITDDMRQAHPKYNLTIQQIIEIKKLLWVDKVHPIDIAKKFNSTVDVIRGIRSGHSYKVIPNPTNVDLNFRAPSRVKKLNDQKVKEIKILIKEGKLTNQEIADLYDVTQGNISTIANGKTWKHIIIDDEDL